ncbi:putative ferric reductase transmembrane component [Candida viswanathii]|uniref:Putative ferric reductase transmembrane component n=1 Tax=Candida viswanathii TaxID=5486 RepID=A0A367YLF3_9ASCO|nr:putative ferric reductase transmembrane component [Candida viswanathii]
MYYPGLYASAALAILLVPFLVPIRIKSVTYRRIKTILILCLIISLFVTLTPETAQIGAPFHKYGKAKIAFFGCNYQIKLTQAEFCHPNASLEWCYCNNFSAFATIAHCYDVGHKDEVASLLGMCKEFNKTLTRSMFEHANCFYDDKAIYPIQKFPGSELAKYPVKLNDSMIYVFKQSYELFLGNYDLSIDYGAYLAYYFIGVMVLVSLGNWSKMLFPGLTKLITDPVTNWFRKNISTPAVSRHKTNEYPMGSYFDMLVPTRLESLILVGATILTMKFFIVHIEYVEGDPIFHTKIDAYLRNYAVRASLMGSSITPLLVLFGGRNNFLQWVTRWDYSTFIMFHRWISRLAVLLFIIHTYCYKIFFLRINHEFGNYVYWGGAAMTAGMAILVQGILYLRRRNYEVFLILHIILAAVFIFGAWVHVNDFYCVWFYYTSAAIWGFDRLVRILRLYAFGFPEADVYLLPDDTLKVVVPKPDEWEAVPGGHVFIHFLRWKYFWQSHPFTYVVSPDNKNIVLYCKVKGGVTKALGLHLAKQPGQHARIRVAVEGAYGETTPAHYADTAVFVAGGNGIPGIYCEVMDMADKLPSNSNRRMKLYWVVRDYNSLTWFLDELKLLKTTKIETTIYVSRPLNPLQPVTNKSPPLELQPLLGSGTHDVITTKEDLRLELAHIHIFEGRPKIDKLVEQEIEESRGSTAFVTCGHPAMVDDIRAEAARRIDNIEHKRVDYYEQLQVWA